MILDGILTFESLYHALRSERAAIQAGIPGRLVPAPRDLSATCVTALRFPWGRAADVTALMNRLGIEYDESRHYPEQQALPNGWAT